MADDEDDDGSGVGNWADGGSTFVAVVEEEGVEAVGASTVRRVLEAS